MTVDNLTFDQLDAIFARLNDYRSAIPPLDVTANNIKQVIFKYLGAREGKAESDVRQLKGFPIAKATGKEMQAWRDTGMKESLSVFLKKRRKREK